MLNVLVVQLAVGCACTQCAAVAVFFYVDPSAAELL